MALIKTKYKLIIVSILIFIFILQNIVTSNNGDDNRIVEDQKNSKKNRSSNADTNSKKRRGESDGRLASSLTKNDLEIDSDKYQPLSLIGSNNTETKVHKINAGKNILLLSTLGRSGSSWAAELLTQQPESFYIYEPDYYLVNKLNYDFSSKTGLNKVKSILECKMDQKFLDFVLGHWHFPQRIIKSSYTQDCPDFEVCFTEDNMSKNCLESKFRIIKMIRLHLKMVDQILSDEVFRDLKVIYIVRDPRAVIQSRTRLGWGTDIETKCKLMEENLEWYQKLHKKYPKNVEIIRYEDLCINTSEEGNRIYQFLSENSSATMPRAWVKFFVNHSKLTHPNNAYSTKRDTKREWMAWRKEIKNENLFQETERYCKNVIRRLGYNIFGSAANAENLSFPVFRPKNECSVIPC